MDGHRIIELALDVPDAIAKERRSRVAGTLALRHVDPTDDDNDAKRWVAPVLETIVQHLNDGGLDSAIAGINADTSKIATAITDRIFDEIRHTNTRAAYEKMRDGVNQLLCIVVDWAASHPRLDGDLPAS